MKFGIIDYTSTYYPELNQVCITETATQPAIVRCYTRPELEEMIAEAFDGRKEIYIAALAEFPA